MLLGMVCTGFINSTIFSVVAHILVVSLHCVSALLQKNAADPVP